MGQKGKRQSVLEELEAIAPKLAQLKKKEHPVDIPVDYFDALSADVFRRIKEEKTAPGSNWFDRRRMFWQELPRLPLRPSYAFALTGVVVLLIGLTVFLVYDPPSSSLEIALSNEEINNYIDLHIDDFELSLLAEETPVDPLDEEMFSQEDSLEEGLMENYFDELLDDLELEEFL